MRQNRTRRPRANRLMRCPISGCDLSGPSPDAAGFVWCRACNEHVIPEEEPPMTAPRLIHRFSGDPGFCGSTDLERQFTLNDDDATCRWCPNSTVTEEASGLDGRVG